MVPYFKDEAFKVRRQDDKDGKRILTCVRLKAAIHMELPSKPTREMVDRVFEDVHVTYDPETGRKKKRIEIRKVRDEAQLYRFPEEGGDHHGGWIKGDVGDYLLSDGDTFFVVPDRDLRSRKPIFDELYVKVL